jgi:hypothetical protein
MRRSCSSTQSQAPARLLDLRPAIRVAIVGALAAGSLFTGSAAIGAPATGVSPRTPTVRLLTNDSHLTLARLEARAAKLSRQYRGQIVKLNDAVTAAKTTAAHALSLGRQLGSAQQQLARLAASYIAGGLDPSLAILTEGDPQRALDRTATVEYLARQRSIRAQGVQRLMVAANRAEKAARADVTELRGLIAKLVRQRRTVERLMAKFQPESPTIGGDRITPRMREVRDEIDRRFGPFPEIACYRPGSDGEHPLGRACDFMLSTGGVMPSSTRVQLGYDVAAWAQANASRLGIMYIVYRQRIWDIRMASSGWVPMEDRGSITANHFDHVHVSVF